jgi:hypothetical protein
MRRAQVRALPPPASVMRMRVDLESMGYLSEEFTISGEARSFARDSAEEPYLPTIRVAGSARYCTRVAVFRPSGPARFSGTAVVEWLNCRDGTDTVPQWLRMHRHIVRSGMAWVGVSTQRIAVEGHGDRSGLKAVDPARYVDLHHPGDAFSYDIFRQTSLLIRQGGLPFPAPTCMLALGSSQSARYLTMYINAVEVSAGTFDGFLLTGRHKSAATLDGASVCGNRVPVRADTGAPVMVLQSETDVFGRMNSFAVRQEDTAQFRLWEVAGAAHADSYITRVGKIDDGVADAVALAAAYAVGVSERLPLKAPMNASPAFHYVHHAALHHLEAWARSGVEPPSAPLLRGNPARGIERDGLGIALSGVRTPWVDCPAQVYSGENDEGGEFEALFGRTLALSPEALSRLYPGGAEDYLDRFALALRRTIAAGFLLEADAREIRDLARALFTGPGAVSPI